MINELTITPEPINEYCKDHSSTPSSELLALIPATQAHAPNVAHMQVGPLEGNFLSIIAQLMGAKYTLEFGTFTGYSALATAEGLPKDGKVTTLDRDPKATAVAQEFWKKSVHGDKIELILGDARKSIQNLENEIQNGKRQAFDLSFIDADKSGYETYYEASLNLVRKGGAILVDNVLWSGRVLNPEDNSDHTIHNFNQKIANDNRVQKVMIPLRDGITLMIKK